MRAEEVIATVEHTFELEAIKRSILKTDDVDVLHQVALKLIETNESTRSYAAELMLENLELHKEVFRLNKWDGQDVEPDTAP